MSAPATGGALKVLTLGLQGEIFAIEAGSVREILDVVPITEVPNARAFVGGLINVRGRVVPLADLRVMFGMDRPPPDADTRIVVIEIDLEGDPTIAAILADRVHDVTDIAPNTSAASADAAKTSSSSRIWDGFSEPKAAEARLPNWKKGTVYEIDTEGEAGGRVRRSRPVGRRRRLRRNSEPRQPRCKRREDRAAGLGQGPSRQRHSGQGK